MNEVLLTRVESLFPEARRFLSSFRNSRNESAKLAIANIVLRSGTTQLREDEILYFARVKADADHRTRRLDENLRARHAAKAQPGRGKITGKKQTPPDL